MKQTKNLLVDAILDLSGDEFETKEEIANLSKENIQQLVERLISIAEYYRDERN